MKGAEGPTERVGPAEVARILGVHHNTVKRIPAAELPYVRIGTRGDRRYARGDVEAFLASRRVEE